MLKLSYPEERTIFYHPKSKEEFEKLMNQLLHAKEIGDHNGVFTLAMQLIPTVVTEE